MPTSTVQLRNIPDTEAALGWVGGHTMVVDRPDGKAGGMGLGFNGGQLLALAIGGCLCNDLRYVAHEMGIALETIEVDVELELDGSPLIATRARMTVKATSSDPQADIGALIDRARRDSTVSNSIMRGFPVETVAAGTG